MEKEEFKIMIEKRKQEIKLEQEEFLARHDYMHFEECKEGYTYEVDGRNFTYAIFYKGVFYGIRHKFGDTFIDNEIHWDKDDHYGTVKPLKEIEKTPENIFNIFKFYIDTNYHTEKKDRFTIAFNVVRQYLDKFK